MNILIQITKITTLSVFFLLVLQLHTYAVSVKFQNTPPAEMSEAQNDEDASGNNNKYKFKTSQIDLLGSTGVALATNVGTKITKNAQQNKQAISIGGENKTGEVVSLTPTAGNNEHMAVIKDYYNLMKTPVKELLDASSDTSETLESFIAQLEYRYRFATVNISALTQKKAELSKQYYDAQQKISAIKVKINTDFKNFDGNATDQNILDYLSYKKEYDYARTHIIFANQYIRQYEYLNNYNKLLLDALINNKDAIIKNSYVVVPDTGIDILKQMDLIISEQEFKAQE